MTDCVICCNKMNNYVICNKCSINKEDPKYICDNCIVKISIEDNFLIQNDNLIEDDDVKKINNYDNIMIIYNCPYCQSMTDFKITDIDSKENIIKIFINILKDKIELSYKNDEFTNKVVGENVLLKRKIERYKNRLNVISIFNEKYYIIIVVLIMNFCFLLGFTIMINIK